MSIEKLKKQENIGVSLIAVGMGGFFLSMWFSTQLTEDVGLKKEKSNKKKKNND